MMKPGIKPWHILLILVIIGAILRFASIHLNQFWHDEVWTFIFARMTFGQIWEAFMIYEPSPPLFYWLGHTLTLIGGFNPYVFRPTTAIFGIALIPVMYLIGKEYVDLPTGLTLAFLTAINPFYIYYAQEARTYTLMVLLNALTLLVYLKYLKTREWPYIPVMVVIAALSVWAQWFSGIFIVVILSHMLITSRGHLKQSLKHILLFSGLLFVTVAPLLPVVIEHSKSRTFMAMSWGYQGLDFIWILFQSLSGYNWLAAIVIVSLFILGMWYGWKKNRNITILLALLVIIPAVIGMIISFKIPMTPRYMAFVSIGFLAGIAPAISLIWTRAGEYRYHLTALAIILMIMAGIPFYATNYTVPSKFDWPQATRIVTNLSYDGDYVVAVPPSITVILTEHYLLYTPPRGTLHFVDGNTFDEIKGYYNLSVEHNVTYLLDENIATEKDSHLWEWLDTHTNPIYQDPMARIYYVSQRNLST